MAVIAHEIRNALSAIQNAVELMRAQEPVAPGPELAWQVIERQVKFLERLANDLHDNSSVSRSPAVLLCERVLLRDVVHNAVASSHLCEDRYYRALDVSIPDSPVYFDADPTRLNQILVNLLNNAIKFTSGAGHISLQGRQEGSELVLSVEDDGIGIAKDDQETVFSLFVQLNRTANRYAEDIGVGLALVERLVQLHGGTIEVASPGLGLGSRFTVRLPIDQKATTVGGLHLQCSGV